MKTLIVYSSETGNSYKLAKAFWEGLTKDDHKEKRIFSIHEHPNPVYFDLIVSAFWVKDGKPDPKTMEFLPTVGEKPLYLLATHASKVGSVIAEKAMEQAKKRAKNAKIVGTFSCQGKVFAPALAKAQSMSKKPAWLADAPSAEGHPNKEETDRVESIAAKIKI